MMSFDVSEQILRSFAHILLVLELLLGVDIKLRQKIIWRLYVAKGL